MSCFQVIHFIQCDNLDCCDSVDNLITRIDENGAYENEDEWDICDECKEGIYRVHGVSEVIIAFNQRKAQIIYDARLNRKDVQTKIVSE